MFSIEISHPCIGICGLFVIEIEIILAVFVEEEPAKIGCISDVSDLFKLLWQGKINEVFQCEKVNLVEDLLDSHCA